MFNSFHQGDIVGDGDVDDADIAVGDYGDYVGDYGDASGDDDDDIGIGNGVID